MLNACIAWHENIYGHMKRLKWLFSHCSKRDKILEVGCGTGYMISLPFLLSGYNILGIDLDENSIAVGAMILEENNCNPKRLQVSDISKLDSIFDIIIVSEVLEHLDADSIPTFFSEIHHHLSETGKLLVTVPNGYGWYELENFIWNKLRLGKLLEVFKIQALIHKTKKLLIKNECQYPYPSTLDESPHLQHFSLSSIRHLLCNNGFAIKQAKGTVFFAGQISNMIFTGITIMMKLNCFLGDLAPKLSSGFMLYCIKKDHVGRNN